MNVIRALPVVLFLSLTCVDDGWSIFARVNFKPKYSQEYGGYFLCPQFGNDIRSREGTEVSLRGYYIPFDMVTPNAIVLSKNPYSACFFCGAAGPESVAEVVFSKKMPRLRLDQIVTVRGKLKLNDTNVDRLTFIIEGAIVADH